LPLNTIDIGITKGYLDKRRSWKQRWHQLAIEETLPIPQKCSFTALPAGNE
jgi:hypothetical protein